MKYDIENNSLYTESGELIKKLSCPLNKVWQELAPFWPGRDRLLHPPREVHWDIYGKITLLAELTDNRPPAQHQRWCCDCDKVVVNIADHNEEQLQTLVEHDPDICIHCPLDHPAIRWVSGTVVSEPPSCAIRSWEREIPFIRTLRQPRAILAALREGKQLLFFLNTRDASEWLERTDGKSRRNLERCYVLIDQENDFLELLDGRQLTSPNQPDGFEDYDDASLSAAYVIPPDLKPGTRILVGDLIEELAWSRGRSGARYYKQSEATWNGKYPEYEHSGPHVVG